MVRANWASKIDIRHNNLRSKMNGVPLSAHPKFIDASKAQV